MSRPLTREPLKIPMDAWLAYAYKSTPCSAGLVTCAHAENMYGGVCKINACSKAIHRNPRTLVTSNSMLAKVGGSIGMQNKHPIS